jgi:hypothetical protein
MTCWHAFFGGMALVGLPSIICVAWMVWRAT